MVLGSQRAGLAGSPLLRLLARLAPEAGGTGASPAFAERLSHWLGWAHAISLSAALASPAEVPARRTARPDASAEEREFNRVHATLLNAVADAPPVNNAQEPADFAPYRRHYQGRQQAMEASIGSLRGRLRQALASRGADMAGLAAVDTVMEQVLGVQEHNLLAGLPALLHGHFDRLRQGEEEAGAWLDVFRADLRSLLLAELDLRMQPVAGLLEALRHSE